jgi:uncharacterized protein YeaO (DUF488 family)
VAYGQGDVVKRSRRSDVSDLLTKAHADVSRGGMDIRLKRAYEPPSTGDGYRILVDRLWPRGLSKRDAELDEWAQELSPSTGLREWFGHDPSRFAEFRRRYAAELGLQRPRLAELRRRARRAPLTLVYSAHDSEHNDAVVLAEALRRGLPTSADAGGEATAGKEQP